MRTMYINNTRIAGLLREQTFKTEFGIFSNPPTRRCTCPLQTNQIEPDYDRIKQSLATMPDDRKAVFAQLLGVGSYAFRWHDGTTSRHEKWPAVG